MAAKMCVFINGYGAPAEPRRDPALEHYLRNVVAILNTILGREDCTFEIYFGGGYTNRLDKTEAAALQENWRIRSLDEELRNSLCHLILGDTGRENLCLLRKEIGDVPVIIFCEYSRRFAMRFLTQRYFSEALVVGIRFDEPSLTPRHQLAQLLVRLPLEVVAWYWEPANKLRLWLRQGHVRRVRAREAAAVAAEKK